MVVAGSYLEKISNRWAVTGAILVLACLATLITYTNWYHRHWRVYHGYIPLPFSPTTWPKTDPEQRGYMLDDLLAKHPLTGMTAGEVEALLGRPDSGGKGVLSYEIGYRGFNKHALLVFSYSLFIILDEQGRVANVFTGD